MVRFGAKREDLSSLFYLTQLKTRFISSYFDQIILLFSQFIKLKKAEI